MLSLAFALAASASIIAPESSGAPVAIRDYLADRTLTRAGAPVALRARIANMTEASVDVLSTLSAPAGVTVEAPGASRRLRLEAGEEKAVLWSVTARRPLYGQFRMTASAAGKPAAEAALPIRFLEASPARKGYIPAPKAPKTELLIGAHHCPLWEANRPEMWRQIRKHPERVPALGFYSQESPEVSDWETKWAVEHGISFFIYCWYRASQGGPVQQQFGSAIHEGLMKSRHAGAMRFTIMWENQSRGTSGVSDEADLLGNLLPFWIENYFRHPSYLKVDNRPVLFIYRPEFLVDDLGGVDKVVQAFDKMRQACRNAGFSGLTLLGEYRGLDANHLRLLKRLGLDYSFAYCWHVANNPTPRQAIDTQLGYIRQTQDLGILPQVVTLSQAWSGWADEGSIWKIPPAEFEDLLRQGRDFVSGLPRDQLSGRMLLLDNWNEWGEGHYIAPYTEYGFGYLDAVRKVFAPNAGPHRDLLPEDLMMGPYDRPYRTWVEDDARLRSLVSQKATKQGADTNGLIGWWAFDERDDSPVALDYSGRRNGAMLRSAKRAPGVDGRGLECKGGCAVVPSAPALSVTQALTIECWAWPDRPDQENNWLVNRVFSGGTDTGYRLGLVGGRACFEIPVTSFSHHLMADEKLPVARWVHIAGTFDGTTMRLYVDGRLCGTMERRGPIKPNDFHLCLGNYEIGHRAYFDGKLDEVRLYSRALPADEIARHAARPGAGGEAR